MAKIFEHEEQFRSFSITGGDGDTPALLREVADFLTRQTGIVQAIDIAGDHCEVILSDGGLGLWGADQ